MHKYPTRTLLKRVPVLGGLKPTKTGPDTNFGGFLSPSRKPPEIEGFNYLKWDVSSLAD
jgi:hypothetical protein